MYAINGTYVGVSVGKKLSSHCFNFKISSSPSLYIKQHPTLMTWYNAAKGKCEGAVYGDHWIRNAEITQMIEIRTR